MYCRVVPLTRTPPGVEVFDYRVPPTMDVQVGDLILVPFRRSKMPALVLAVMQTSPFASKAQDVIGSYAGIRFPLSVIELLDYAASHTFTSKPAVLKSWLRSLPKRVPETITAAAKTHTSGKADIRAHWAIDHEEKLIERAKALLHEGKRVLILSPWKARLSTFLKAVEDGAIYSSDLNDGDAFRAWSGFYSGTTRCVIATRLGAWLAPLADVVLIDEPENDDFKQDELAPRYDARKLALWSAEHASVIVEAYGLTPPLHSDEPAPAIRTDLSVMIRHPKGHSSIPMVQGEALNMIRDHEGPRIIIHPIKGEVARLTCRDCGHRVTCSKCDFVLSADGPYSVCRRCGSKAELPLSCPTCGGTDLGKSLPGIERLKSAWKKQESDIEVEWRGVSNEDFELPILQHAAVLVTDPSLITGGSEDVRRLERLAVGFRRLARDVFQANGKLIIQSDESMAPFWNQVLDTEGFKTYREQERAVRNLFQYPPAKRLIKVIMEEDGKEPLTSIEKLAEVRGPYPVAYRVKSRKKRYIWHILPKTNTVQRELIDALAILSKRALIDLDPIAFLR